MASVDNVEDMADELSELIANHHHKGFSAEIRKVLGKNASFQFRNSRWTWGEEEYMTSLPFLRHLAEKHPRVIVDLYRQPFVIEKLKILNEVRFAVRRVFSLSCECMPD